MRHKKNGGATTREIRIPNRQKPRPLLPYPRTKALHNIKTSKCYEIPNNAKQQTLSLPETRPSPAPPPKPFALFHCFEFPPMRQKSHSRTDPPNENAGADSNFQTPITSNGSLTPVSWAGKSRPSGIFRDNLRQNRNVPRALAVCPGRRRDPGSPCANQTFSHFERMSNARRRHRG